jgi:hypothetical protein
LLTSTSRRSAHTTLCSADFSICGFHEAYEIRPANFHQGKAFSFSPANTENRSQARFDFPATRKQAFQPDIRF